MAINVKNDIKPTDEQRNAIALFSEGDNLAIEAGAGTGKTSTLKMLGKYNKSKGQYIAFNKAIVEDAKTSFPNTINCNTAHSLAFAVKGRIYSDRLFKSQRVKSVDVGRFLNLKPMILNAPSGERKILSVSQLGSLANRAVDKFCNSADLEFLPSHVPYIDGIDAPFNSGGDSWKNNNAVREAILPTLGKYWADLQDPKRGFLQFKHQHYLKMWQLDDPKIKADFILFDEAQDANPVILDIVKRQVDSQLVFVGDSQQQIYSFTGAVNAMQQLPAESRTFLTQSFRFGNAIAEEANRILSMLSADLRLKGFEKIDSYVSAIPNPKAILARTNAVALQNCMDVLDSGRSVCLVGGTAEIRAFCQAALDLQNKRGTYHPELSCFTDWDEVVEYVKYDEDGSDLKLLVGLIQNHGAEKLLNVMREISDENSEVDVVVSTAHKSKGREWDTVQLAGDFPALLTCSVEELRLIYVAMTRAKLGLDKTNLLI